MCSLGTPVIHLLLPQQASRGSSGGCSVALWVFIITSFLFSVFLVVLRSLGDCGGLL